MRWVFFATCGHGFAVYMLGSLKLSQLIAKLLKQTNDDKRDLVHQPVLPGSLFTFSP
jgi:hypothetical protein